MQVNEPRADAVKPTAGPDQDPLRFLMEAATLEQVIWATRKALAFLLWARRFAESQLKEPDDTKKEPHNEER